MAEDRNSIWRSRNHQWINPTMIDMEVEHPEMGWVPFSASSEDENTLALFMDGEAALGPYTGVAPEPPGLPELRARTSIRKMDLLFAMNTQLKLISPEEAKAAVTTGEIPKVFEPLLAELSPEQRLYVEMEFAGENRVARTWPILETFARAIYGERGTAVLDALFGLREMPNVGR